MGFYRVGDIIKYTRLSLGLTQEELSEGICTTESLSRFETGKLTPRKGIYVKLMKKMNKSPERYLIPVYSKESAVDRIIRQISYEKERMDYGRVRELLERLRESNDIDIYYPQNKQYISMITLIVQSEENKITIKEYKDGLEDALRLTFPEYEEAFPIKRLFTANEINLLNNIANAYANMGDAFKAVAILYRTKEYFEKVHLGNDDKEYNIVLLSLANKLGRMKRYEESIKICEEGIQWLKRDNRSGYLYNFIYNIGWNYVQIYIDGGKKETEKYQLAKRYMKQACYINVLCDESKDNLHIMKQYYHEIFQEDI